MIAKCPDCGRVFDADTNQYDLTEEMAAQAQEYADGMRETYD